MGGYNAIVEAGLRMPEDVSAMGYDGINLARLMHLTTYTQNALEIGKTAAEHLIRRIEHPSDFSPQQVLVSGALQKGKSVQDLNK
jgi:LacI family transcriptional regulator/LacI family purine nucleotide synthesis repressor